MKTAEITKKKQKEKWIKPRHKVVRSVLYYVIYPYTRLRYGIKIDRFKEQGGRQYLIMLNHQTVFDQFFVGLSFKNPVYYLATEDIFSMGWVSKLITWLVAPIPIKKQTTDLQAVKTCIRVAREGGTIALAPEGNRTYSGKTEYIKPAIIKLARALKLPIAFYRIEGGYGVQPRWSDVLRRGKMHSYVSRVVEPEEYLAMSDDELYELVCNELYVDEGRADGFFYHKKSAEYLERAMYVCPFCGLAEFESRGDTITCRKCGRQIRYLPSKELEGAGFQFPFRFVTEWYDHQVDFVSRLDLSPYLETPMYRDDARLSEVILYKNKNLIQNRVDIALYGDRITIKGSDGLDLLFPFEDTRAVTVLGRNKLNIYFDGKVYQLKGEKSFNALKYVNIFYHYKNISEGNANGKFLGL